MNHVWVFFKLIEVIMGSVCMVFHVNGSMYEKEPLPHVLIYCATFLAFILLTGLGGFRVIFIRTSVLSTQVLITGSAAFFHYVCGLLILRTAKEDPHLRAINNTFEYMKHEHFAHCKQQSIASLATATMYLMHMFHVLDILLRLEPGDWRRQALVRENHKDISEFQTRAGLYILSKPVDNFLCDHFPCYDNLAHSQPLHFQITRTEQSETAERVWHFLANVRAKLCSVSTVDSEESFMSTPSITTSESSETEELAVAEESRDKRRSAAANWRGPSDSSSLWAQIEDRSTLNSMDSINELLLSERRGRRSTSIYDDLQNREKSDILLVEQDSRNMSKISEAGEPRKSSRGSSVTQFRAAHNREEEKMDGEVQETSFMETTDQRVEDEEHPQKAKRKK